MNLDLQMLIVLKAVDYKVAKTEKLIAFLKNQSYTAAEVNPILTNKDSALRLSNLIKSVKYFHVQTLIAMILFKLKQSLIF